MEEKYKTYKIFIVSGGTERTAKKVLNAALTQFNKKNLDIVQFSDVREIEQIKNIIDDAIENNALIIHTLVEDNLKDFINEECIKYNIKNVDLLTNMISNLSNLLDEESSQTPGLFNRLNEEYFKRIDAVQYTFKHDDGARVEDIRTADIILLGVSRTFKTPLSVYLAYKGFFVMNIPIVNGIQPPIKLLKEVDPKKIFCLTTNPIKLSELRHSRNVKLGGNVQNYSDYESCKKDLNFATRFYNLHPQWNCVNVTEKSIEEIATEIIERL